jgi:subtilisin family serine protease
MIPQPVRRACVPALLLLTAAVLAAAPGEETLTKPVPLPPSVAKTTLSPSGSLSRADHLLRLGAATWHTGGHRGQGIKVAILDSGFHGYRKQLGKALPKKVAVKSFRIDGQLEARSSQHGVLCGEVVHAVAPDAELMFANWESSSPRHFLDAVRWAVSQGANIISCSIIMPTWSDGEGGGPVHAELARILGQGKERGDVLFFACAGNTADRHWSGPFRDDGKGSHVWDDGIDNPVSPWSDGRVSVEMCAEQDADLELIVRDSTTEEDVGACRLQCGPYRTAVVRFAPQKGRSYDLRVRATGPNTKARFHLFVLGGSLAGSRALGSIAFPGDGPLMVTVGAVERDNRRASYSSCGPNSPRLKPDLVALVPFASRFRSRPFTGTSAATPQAAALGALLWSRHPDWTASKVREHLEKQAQDLGPRGHDWETGHGLVRLGRE